MRLFEFTSNTTDPQTLLNKVAADIEGAERRDCHGQCAAAIRDGSVEDSDIVVILGPQGAKGKVGYHSVIISKTGEIKVDSYSNRMTDYDTENGIFYYDIDRGEPVPMTYKTYATVGKLKTM